MKNYQSNQVIYDQYHSDAQDGIISTMLWMVPRGYLLFAEEKCLKLTVLHFVDQVCRFILSSMISYVRNNLKSIGQVITNLSFHDNFDCFDAYRRLVTDPNMTLNNVDENLKT